uniref:Ig-like domain-containing protein n=1 Tax=Astyanax mexicanus TaxID=7994 RepID=A0A3B1JSD2_ASTMX
TMMFLCSLTVFIIILRNGSAQSIEPLKNNMQSKTEGESVTLKCSYETSSNAVVLFWYRQYSNRALQYLLYRGALYQSGDDHTADKVSLADTALYYCALQVSAHLINYGTQIKAEL